MAFFSKKSPIDDKISNDLACQSALSYIPNALKDNAEYIGMMLQTIEESGSALANMRVNESFSTPIACHNGNFYKVTKTEYTYKVEIIG